MNKKVNDFLWEVIENLTYFVKKTEDNFTDYHSEVKEWWQHYLMCMVFCLFAGIMVAALSAGLLMAEKKTDGKFFNEDFVKDGSPDLYKNAENLLVVKREPSAVKSVVAVKGPKIKE